MIENSENAKAAAERAKPPTRVMRAEDQDGPIGRFRLRLSLLIGCRLIGAHEWRALQHATEFTRSKWDECEICGARRNFDWERI